jgi:phosphatidylserine/phosphatidylglycerophosphate/cardiolipin synthase-like enzyme
MVERECNFLPFDQPFLVSQRLLTNSLDILDSVLKNPISFSPLKRGLMKEYKTFLSVATNKIDVATPWISPEIVKDLIDLHVRKQIKIRIITKEDAKNETQVQSLDILKSATEKFSSDFKVRTVDELHAKGILVDDIMVLHGSFNLTLTGLNSNVENATMDCSILGSKKFAEEFDRLWEGSKEV